VNTPVLAELTTLRVGGPARRYVAAETEAELISAIRAADAADVPLLMLGGGSNLLAADAGFDGLVLQDRRRGVQVQEQTSGRATVRVPAGQPWDPVVEQAVAEGWSGIEALSGIPGSSGATPVQNVGAYGQEISEVLTSVRVWDRDRAQVRTLTAPDLQFGYRTSVLKRSLIADDRGRQWFPTPRYVVLEVTMNLATSSESAPVRYTELAGALGVDLGQRAPAGRVRQVVLELRRGKGMVLQEADHDTWSAGSFFTNPILDADAAADLPAGAPTFEAGSGRVKTSAAWLISRAGFDKGYGLPGPAALSTKHVLALTNRGGASAEDLLSLARAVRAGVQDSFGVHLVPEPVLLTGGL